MTTPTAPILSVEEIDALVEACYGVNIYGLLSFARQARALAVLQEREWTVRYSAAGWMVLDYAQNVLTDLHATAAEAIESADSASQRMSEDGG